MKTTKTNWKKKKKKKEEYQLFLELNNLYPVFQFFHIHSLFYTLDISLLSSSFQRILKEKTDMKKKENMKTKKKERRREKKKKKLWMGFEEERVC